MEQKDLLDPNITEGELLDDTVARLTAATATLERVRAAHDALPAEPRLDQWLEFGDSIGAALASQPEAPAKHKAWCAQMTMVARKCDCRPQELKDAALASQPEAPCSDCGSTTEERSPCPGCKKVFCQSCAEKPEFCCDGQPEAPKEERIETRQVRPKEQAAFKAAKAQDDAEVMKGFLDWVRGLERDLAAAKAKIAELEQQKREDEGHIVRWVRSSDAANARADAAERREHRLVDACDQTSARLAETRTERDQLAARVTELVNRESVPYTERNTLVAFLARQFPAGLRKTEIEGWDPEWHGCVFIDTPEGQMSWHYHDSDAHLFAGLPPYEKPWDGHTTAEKYTRLMLLGPVCTPDQRKVLEACRDAHIATVYMGTAVQILDQGSSMSVATAELANRAAKAKRGGQVNECSYVGSFCGDTGCSVHGLGPGANYDDSPAKQIEGHMNSEPGKGGPG